MFKKLSFVFFIIIVLILNCISVYIMYRNSDPYAVNIDPGKVNTEIFNFDDIWEIYAGDIECFLNTKGVVAPASDIALKIVYINGNKNDININVKINDIVEKNSVIASYKADVFKAESKMKCINIEQDDEGCNITFLDYSKLYIQTNLDVDSLNYDLFNKTFSLSNNLQSFNGTLSYIDYKVENNSVYAKITYANEDILLMPGMIIDVRYTL